MRSFFRGDFLISFFKKRINIDFFAQEQKMSVSAPGWGMSGDYTQQQREHRSTASTRLWIQSALKEAVNKKEWERLIRVSPDWKIFKVLYFTKAISLGRYLDPTSVFLKFSALSRKLNGFAPVLDSQSSSLSSSGETESKQHLCREDHRIKMTGIP